MWVKYFKQLWPSAIRKKPSQSCAHFCLYTYYCSTRYILSKETHRISQINDPFNTQFPKLSIIHCKFSCVEGHVTKYYCYVMLDTIGHVAKYLQTCIWDSSTVFAMWTILGCHDLGRGVPSAKLAAENQPKPMHDTLTNTF